MSSSSRKFLALGGFLGAISVAIGAFGAHGLEDYLEQTGRTETFETAVSYLWYHTFALLFIGVLLHIKDLRTFKIAGICFFLGILIFSGSLMVLIATGNTIFGMITPIGGLAFIIGWILTSLGAFKMK